MLDVISGSSPDISPLRGSTGYVRASTMMPVNNEFGSFRKIKLVPDLAKKAVIRSSEDFMAAAPVMENDTMNFP